MVTGISAVSQLEVHSIHHVFVAVTSDICAQQKRRDGKRILKGGKGFHWVVSWKDQLLGGISGCAGHGWDTSGT